MVSADVAWAVIRNNSAFLLKKRGVKKAFSTEPCNLTNTNSQRLLFVTSLWIRTYISFADPDPAPKQYLYRSGSRGTNDIPARIHPDPDVGFFVIQVQYRTLTKIVSEFFKNPYFFIILLSVKKLL